MVGSGLWRSDWDLVCVLGRKTHPMKRGDQRALQWKGRAGLGALTRTWYPSTSSRLDLWGIPTRLLSDPGGSNGGQAATPSLGWPARRSSAASSTHGGRSPANGRRSEQAPCGRRPLRPLCRGLRTRRIPTQLKDVASPATRVLTISFGEVPSIDTNPSYVPMNFPPIAAKSRR